MAITGRAAALAALGIVAVIVWPAGGTIALWALVWLLAVVVDLLIAASPRRLSFARTVPRSVRLTERAATSVLVRNDAGRRARLIVRDAWQPSAGAPSRRHRVTLPAGEMRRLRTELVPRRRGDLRAGKVTVRSLGPLGLAGRQASIAVPGSIRVLPEFRSRRLLPSYQARLREMDGRTAVMIRGQGTEFDSLREYTWGDDVRSIDWRATARAERVMVRTWRPERDRRVLIVVDTSRVAAARLGDETRLDASIEAALFLGVLASRAGDRVEVVAVDRVVRAQVMGAAGHEVLPEFASALAGLQPQLVEADWGVVASTVALALTGRALVVILTGLDPAALEAGLVPVLPALTRDHKVVVAGAADPELAEMARERASGPELFDAAAAERVALERAAVSGYMERLGARVVDRSPGDLAAGVADAYLALKESGQL